MSKNLKQKVQNTNKGITLVALIITVIVLAILATVSLQAINGEGIIGRAQEAAFKAEMTNLKDDLGIFVSARESRSKNGFDLSTLNASINGAYFDNGNGTHTDLGSIDNILPSLKESRRKQIEIIKGEMIFASQNKNELRWAQELGIGINPYYIVDGVLMSSDNNLMLMGDDGVLALPTSITSIADGTFSQVEGIKKVIIPGNVKEIGDNAFYGIKTLEEVVIEDGVEKIGNYAFYNCTSLNKIQMGNKVTSIGDYAFYSCGNLSNLQIGSSVETIGNYAFGYCSKLVSLEIPDSVTSMGMYAFSACSTLESIVLPQNLETIPDRCFISCGQLSDVTFPKSLKTIATCAFEGCRSLVKVSLPYGLEELNCFQGCTNLKSIKIPDSVTKIWGSAFCGCTSLTSITIPENVTTLGGFSGCKSLTSITIPGKVTTIMGYAFNDCTSLISVTIPTSVTAIGSGAFRGCTSLTTIDVAKDNTNFSSKDGVLMDGTGSKMIWISPAAPAIKNGTFTIPDTVTKIDNGLIDDFKDEINKVVIPASVSTIDFGFFTTYIPDIKVEINEGNTTYKADSNGIYNYSEDTIWLYLGDKTNIVIKERSQNNCKYSL